MAPDGEQHNPIGAEHVSRTIQNHPEPSRTIQNHQAQGEQDDADVSLYAFVSRGSAVG
jgi:hypothetical protein